MVIFFNSSPTSNHLHPLQVENCDSDSRLVVDEDDNIDASLERVKNNKRRRPDISVVAWLTLSPELPGSNPTAAKVLMCTHI